MVSTSYITQKSTILESEETLVIILSSGSQVELTIRLTNKNLLENGWDLRMWIFNKLCRSSRGLAVFGNNSSNTVFHFMDERLNHNNILCEEYSRRLQSWGREAFQKLKTKNPKANKKKTNLTTKKKKLHFCMAMDPINRNRLEKLHL